VTFETGAAMKLIEAVRERRADAAITALPAPVDGLRTTVLGDEHLVAVVPVSDDRALQPSLTLEQLASSRVLLPPREANPTFHTAVVSMFRNEGLSPEIVELAEPRADLAMLAVASGAGIALLPASVKERHTSPGVRLVDVSAPEPVFQYAALTHPDDDGLPTRALLHALTRAAEQPTATPAPAPAPAPALALVA